MNPYDIHRDPVLAALRELPSRDITRTRARRLRTRCHQTLQAQQVSGLTSRGEGDAWPRGVRVLAGAWCVLYLVEIIRGLASVYAF